MREAEQRFSEVARRAHDEGPQIVTGHGHDVAVILGMTVGSRASSRTSALGSRSERSRPCPRQERRDAGPGLRGRRVSYLSCQR
ncbi:type II toxin-antitoxin system prevent-host-death family antitoxin [Nonomuraea solani]|uniref:type II toxin-antitoxin system prevent-host-death family antitoxin n=1 Tax=Nonomuraea solani TaxID=1144553 RepID=UPI000CDEF0A1|nr:type II toxin-antitoxin system prevent-host-death family antitoxin [Nonomuraea solani]